MVSIRKKEQVVLLWNLNSNFKFQFSLNWRKCIIDKLKSIVKLLLYISDMMQQIIMARKIEKKVVKQRDNYILKNVICIC